MRMHARIVLALIGVVLMTVPPAPAQSTHDTIEYVQPRMVKIFGAGGIKRLYGYSTGFLVSPEGHIATIWSTVLDSETVTVVLDNGRRFEASVVGAEPQLDLAVLKIEEAGLDLPHFDLAAATTVGPGTRVLGFSNMFQVAAGDEAASVLHGVVAARAPLGRRRGAFQLPYQGDVYVVDAITNNPGAGGGLLTTRDGKLLGMIGKELRSTKSNTWLNYAIPLTELSEAVEAIKAGRYVARQKDPDDDGNPKRYAPVDFGMVMVPDVLFRTPAYIDAVETGSLAEQAGLKPDDLVLFVNDELVQSCRNLNRELGQLEAGDDLRIVVRRGDQLVAVEFRAPRKPEQ